MTIEEAREALRELERAAGLETQSLGAQRWADELQAAGEEERARSQEVAWTLVHDGTREERRLALAFWGAAPIPEGVSDALAELYLSEQPPDPNLRTSLGQSTAHTFSEDIGGLLAARFAADPEGERDLAVNAVRFDPHGGAWAALIRLILKSDEATSIGRLFEAAYHAERSDDLVAALKSKPVALLEEVARSMSLRLRARFCRITGITHP